MKINIGAGDTRFDGFVNCDYSDLFNPDYIFDLEQDIFPFDNNSVSEVLAYHVLEHLGEGYFHCLKELYRVCADQAIIRVQVPHYRSENQLHDATHRRVITAHGLNLFNKELNTNSTDNASKLGLHFNVDFRVIDEVDTLNTKYHNYDRLKSKSVQEIKKFAYDKNNVYEETHVTLKVFK